MDLSNFKQRVENIFGIGREYRVFRAPGRVNIIGEHTDYNDGFVLPAAIDRQLFIAAIPVEERVMTMHSLDKNKESVFSLDSLGKCPLNFWSNYIRGVAKAIEDSGYILQGAEFVFGSDIPIGSGLSSSAALCVASGLAFSELNGLNLKMDDIAKFAQRSENDFVGTNCGIMDQFISAMGKENNALLIDCRDLSYELMPFNGDVSIVIADTMIRRGLVDSEYNTRRASCELAVDTLKAVLPDTKALRDISCRELEDNKDLLNEEVYHRARHIVTENERVLLATNSMKKGDFESLGLLLNESHISLRDDYEVSCKGLDMMVEIAAKQNGVYGSRMTGAGFGGCTVSLVEPKYVDEFIKNVGVEYFNKTGKKPNIFSTNACDGAAELRAE